MGYELGRLSLPKTPEIPFRAHHREAAKSSRAPAPPPLSPKSSANSEHSPSSLGADSIRVFSHKSKLSSAGTTPPSSPEVSAKSKFATAHPPENLVFMSAKRKVASPKAPPPPPPPTPKSPGTPPEPMFVKIPPGGSILVPPQRAMSQLAHPDMIDFIASEVPLRHDPARTPAELQKLHREIRAFLTVVVMKAEVSDSVLIASLAYLRKPRVVRALTSGLKPAHNAPVNRERRQQAFVAVMESLKMHDGVHDDIEASNQYFAGIANRAEAIIHQSNNEHHATDFWKKIPLGVGANNKRIYDRRINVLERDMLRRCEYEMNTTLEEYEKFGDEYLAYSAKKNAPQPERPGLKRTWSVG